MRKTIVLMWSLALFLGYGLELAAPTTPFDPLTYTPPVQRLTIKPEECAVKLFVAPNGKDTWSGRQANPAGEDGPFATLTRARDEIRKIKQGGTWPKGGVVVTLRGGVYSLMSSLELTAEDSGQPGSPVIYRAQPGESVRLLGGQKLAANSFQAITDPVVLKRLDPAAQGQVMQANVKTLGLTHGGPFPPVFSDGGGIFELFYNGERMKLSRWPVAGYVKMKQVLTNGDKDTPGVFEYTEDRPARWSVASGLWLKGQWRVGWEDPAIKVAAIDTEKKQITFAAGIGSGIGSKYKRPQGSGQEPWCAINVLEELTQPGQWCLDFTTDTLYFWPPTPLAQADILVSQLDAPLIQAVGLAHAAFVGLTCEGTLGDAMNFAQADSILVAGCTLRNLGGRGVVLDGSGCGIQSCDMFGLGRGCIVISGGDRQTLRPSGNYVLNNHLHHYGVLKAQYSAAVDLYSDNKRPSAVGIWVAHNLIHHAPRDAVLFAGNDNVFELNEIHRCAFDSADVGAFYSWLDWTIRGVVIRHNLIHDTVGGVNPDDGASGTFVLGNIFAGERVGVWIASGPDHIIQNNIFIKPTGPVFGMDDRGMGRGYATNPRLLKAVQDINPTAAPWSVRYPEMATLLESHPEKPLRTKFVGNAIFIPQGEPYSIKMKTENKTDPALLVMDKNWVTATDPGFVNAAGGNFMLKPDAAVYKEIPGFPKIPTDQMGLQLDEYRLKLPTPAEAGRLPEQDPWKPNDKNLNFGT